jgi:effector-binding domain-containing protein
VIASVIRSVPDLAAMDRFCLAMYQEVYRGIADAGMEPLGPEVTLYHNDEYSETDLDVEMGVRISDNSHSADESIPGLMMHVLPAENRMASLLYRGSFKGVVSGVLSLLRWVGLQRLRIGGPLRELHLSGPAHRDGEVQESALLELKVPIIE